jgi:hypothetical protein
MKGLVLTTTIQRRKIMRLNYHPRPDLCILTLRYHKNNFKQTDLFAGG